MSIRVHRFETSDDVEHFLNGGIVGGKEVVQAGRLLGLHGLTLVFNTPSGTVTFDDPTGVGLTLADVKAQVQADVSTIKVTFKSYKIRFIQATPTAPVVLDATGTANSMFGFSDAVDATGIVFAPVGGTPPCVMSTEQNPNQDGWAIFVVMP